MRYFEAPHYYRPVPGDPPAVFIGGGITGVPDWQATAVAALAPHGCVLLNPRRAEFDVGDPGGAEEQIRWECHHRRLDRLLMLLWFPASDARTVQPIALLELGAELSRSPGAGRELVVGADPGYPRRVDVRLQCRFDRPDVTVHDSLAATLAAAVARLPRLAP